MRELGGLAGGKGGGGSWLVEVFLARGRMRLAAGQTSMCCIVPRWCCKCTVVLQMHHSAASLGVAESQFVGVFGAAR